MYSDRSLSTRGNELAELPNMKPLFRSILTDLYDPETNPNGFANIGVSENFIMLDQVKDYVNKNVKFEVGDFSYGEGPAGTLRLRKAMAKHMTHHFNAWKPVDPEHITFANGCTGLFEMIAWTMADPGDGILLPRPIYQAFPHDFTAKAKMKIVYVDVDDVDQFSVDVVGKFEAALLKAEKGGTRVRMLMLCNPHNPLGKCYPKETIIELMKLCEKYKVHLISDEIYATSVFDVPDPAAVPFTSILSFDSSKYISPDYAHVVYGLSKDFGSGGLRLGCLMSTNQRLNNALFQISMFHWSGNPAQTIAAVILEDEAWLNKYIEDAKTKLSAANQLARKALDDAGIDYIHGANAGFFLMLDLRKHLPKSGEFKDGWAAEAALFEKMLKNKVYTNTGQSLGATEPGWFRIIYSQNEAVLREGIKRIRQTLNEDNLV